MRERSSVDAEAGLTARPSRDFRLLIEHFLNRFFNNELMSSGGEAKARLVQFAVAAGLPGFVMALYLYPAYHPPRGSIRPYWAQVGDHYFYCLYSAVASGILTIFAWDFFFPDLLDTYTVGTLPLQPKVVFRARVAAATILIVSFLVDSNFLAPLVLPAATDPPHLGRFLLAHVAAVSFAGIFASAFVLALQGTLLTIAGERIFRKLSPWLQTTLVFALLMLLFLYTTFYSQLRHLVPSSSLWVRCLPPLWFLGIYQRILEGPAVEPGFALLARIAWWATLITLLTAIFFYPLAYRKRVRGLIEGAVSRGRLPLRIFVAGLYDLLAKMPQERAIWHFIGLTILRVPRYRVYLSLYGGAGLALVASSVLRIHMRPGGLAFTFSNVGMRAIIPIVAFWTVSGLHMTFLSPGDPRSIWIFQTIHGAAEHVHLQAAQRWTFYWSLGITIVAGAIGDLLLFGQPFHWVHAATQLFLACALCLLLSDAFFLRVTTVPFTFIAPEIETNLAFLLIPYFGVFPVVLMITMTIEPWIESNLIHLFVTALGIGFTHLGFRTLRQRIFVYQLYDHARIEDRERFPLGLGSM